MANPSVTQEIPKILTAYQQFMYRLMRGAAQEAKTTLKTNKNYATSQLMQSISGDSIIQGHNIVGSFGANTKYAEDVETGIVKDKPSLNDIQDWLVRKVQLGHITLNKWAKKNNITGKTKIKTIDQILYPLSLKITQRIQETGKIKTKPYLRPAYEQMIAKFNAETPLEIK